MNAFQVGVAVIVALLLAATWRMSAQHRLGRTAAAAWSALWLAAIALVLMPNATVALARLLGIGRGADLVFYCGILLMFLGFFVLYLKIRRLQEEITLLVRRLALAAAEKHDADSPKSAR